MERSLQKWLLIAISLSLCLPGIATAQLLLPEPVTTDSRILQLEQIVSDQQRELLDLRSQVESLNDQQDIPVYIYTAQGIENCTPEENDPSYSVTYDQAWVIRPDDAEESPFELRFNLHNQFRYTGFANSVDNFTDQAGNVRSVPPRNDFDINRGRWIVSGYAFDPKFEFYANIDYNTVSSDPFRLLLSRMSYKFDEHLKVCMGMWKLPGTWEWHETSRHTLGAERTMATTYFRPSITAGVWAEGKLSDDVHFQAMIGDGFNTFSLQAAELDTHFVYSGLMWWEPLGAFGPGFSDLECQTSPRTRLGHGFTFARHGATEVGNPGPEQTSVRISDGTRLVEPGALAPGVTINQFDISLYSAHFGYKQRGFSFATEYFFRWLTEFQATGPLPSDSLFDHGFYAMSGLFVVPKRVELFTVGSKVSGKFGDGLQAGGGVNWFVDGERGNRFTFDVTWLEDSPAQQSRTGYIAGGSGALFRVQWWHYF